MPETTGFPTRRGLLTAVAGASLVESFLPRLRAQSVSGNRALVCIYHFDGNDSNNLVVPLDSGRYAAYALARGPLALDRASLLMAQTTRGAQVGFHPAMPELRDLFSRQRLAVVANIGVPASKPPVSLLDPDLKYVPGAFSAPQWAAAFTRSGAISTQEITSGSAGLSRGGGIVRLASGSAGTATLSALRLSTRFPDTALGGQLQKVVTAVAQSPNEAQFFFVPASGFGSGANQLECHAAAMRDLSQAMAAFFDATVELGLSRRITTYTDGIFNRTMAPSPRGRATPAWGSHQLVMGDSVLGAEIYGSFPDFTLGGRDDAGKMGTWIPSVSKAQYHQALARWAGIPDWQLRRSFPAATEAQPANLSFLL
ncbi:MAG: hypothetical protein WBE37_24745 [Bryobacteraceae bacterium]